MKEMEVNLMGGTAYKKKRQYFNCKYHFTNDKGKDYGWQQRKVLAISEKGAEDVIRWLTSSRFQELRIDSIIATNQYVGNSIFPDYKVLGDY